MASSWRSLDLDRVQLRTIFARNDQNVPVPSSLILIANGDGGTRWSSISTILQISSFRTIKGNTTATFSADMSNNVLQISTTGVRGTLWSYASAATSSLMLQSTPPPIGALNVRGAITSVITNAVASNFTGGMLMAPDDDGSATANSTIKFFGVNDIQLSTISTFKSVFITISSFSATGYSSISGELFELKEKTPSTFSTLRGRPCFTSTLTSNAGWLWGSQTAASAGGDLYFSTAVISNIENFARFSENGTTRIQFDYFPNIRLGSAGSSGIYEISTFLTNGVAAIPESVATSYVTAVSGSPSMYSVPAKITMTAATLSNISTTGGANQDLWVNHRVVGGATVFGTGYSNLQSERNSLFITMTTSGPVY